MPTKWRWVAFANELQHAWTESDGIPQSATDLDLVLLVVVSQDISNAFDVSALPTFKVFKHGKVVDELSGAIQSALESTVAKHA